MPCKWKRKWITDVMEEDDAKNIKSFRQWNELLHRCFPPNQYYIRPQSATPDMPGAGDPDTTFIVESIEHGVGIIIVVDAVDFGADSIYVEQRLPELRDLTRAEKIYCIIAHSWSSDHKIRCSKFDTETLKTEYIQPDLGQAEPVEVRESYILDDKSYGQFLVVVQEVKTMFDEIWPFK
ncbi:hypothetical protein BDQ17DRAFT_1426852 [Cyathus striatus]|nr:hypothetical protein BDQ17DRAFT_1426852 [Cyathus striatus]